MGRATVNNGSGRNKIGPTGRTVMWSPTKDCVLKHAHKVKQARLAVGSNLQVFYSWVMLPAVFLDAVS